MTQQLLVAGGGMGGLAAALAAVRAGWQARLFEQAAEFGEVGAGIQLGPNAMRLLASWGLEVQVQRVAAFPGELVARSALNGAVLGRMTLGDLIAARYGAPYATIHRADLHALLLAAAQQAGVNLRLNARIAAVLPGAGAVALRLHDDSETEVEVEVEGDALVGADGLWSVVRGQVHDDGPPLVTGHIAYRALVSQQDLPAALRQQDVHVWMGPHMHLVSYPVRAGELLNVVAIVHGAPRGDAMDWDNAAVAAELLAAMGEVALPLRDLVQAMPRWRLWTLHDRAPMTGPDEMVRGRIALLGDAAHPMRPYLAQGAGMALEDADELGRVLAQADDTALDVPLALRRYALNRWQRDARVQARARRNGRIFHATGFVRWGRDLSMRLLGERLL
ncbi:MAG: FAD-dependent monooxygenase, partial [Burkholderiaceae bacterium]|nr:FAD-dependent monooxygenase [Burkholderiaceae bacterium]